MRFSGGRLGMVLRKGRGDLQQEEVWLPCWAGREPRKQGAFFQER